MALRNDIEEGCITPWWLGLAYHDFMRDVKVSYFVPLNFLVRGFHWLGWKWDRFRGRRSWIDLMVRQAYAKGFKTGRNG